ncbi:prepilin-type N-terminal cleavage/methylation domain-containing protein [bacterium]|nr:prepilin-type N-terminal cleavage/methylation domain-containing protein [bacterium]MBU1957890.1 prepilin-type N-terminal cleavage/methylation domain-containing protein [bacterium]
MKKHKGFSLIEVIFVLVILGIVASIGSSILVQVYENYVMQRAVYNVSSKTELAATQMVNRLSHRIQGTAISKDHDKYLDYYNNGVAIESNDSIALDDIPVGGSKYTTIEWIGYDNDSYDANATPYWSGVANYTSGGGASINGFTTPGSDLNHAATIINTLSNGKVDLTTNHPAAVLFYQENNYYKTGEEYDYNCTGLLPSHLGGTTNCIFPVAQNGSEGLAFTTTTAHPVLQPKIITERYKLAWSAYALAPEMNSKGQYDLLLYSNYQPWNGENYIDHGTKKTIMRNITVFKFSETAGVIQFKLCATEAISKDMNVSNCKEKVVIR